MQKNNWLRLSLASMILAGVGAGSVLQGCSDDPVTPASDAGKDTAPTATTTATGTATGTGTGTTPPDAAPPPESQKIIFVHAANWLGTAFESGTGPAEAVNGAIRLCLRAGPEGTNPFLPVPALPNKSAGGLPFPALLPGTGGVLPAKTDFSTTRLEGYAMNAALMASKGFGSGAGANTSCGDLFSKGFNPDAGPGDGGVQLAEGVDYIKVGVIPAGTFANESTYVVSVQGCAKGYTDATVGVVAAKCGSSYNPTTGNLELKVTKLDRGAVGTSELGAQFMHVTSAADVIGPVNPGVVSGGADAGGDAGAFKPFSPAAVAYNAPITALVKLAGVSLTADALTLNPALPNYSFASAVAATSPSTPIELGKGHVFIAVGEVAAATGPFANRKPHFLAFPTNPTVPALEQ